MSGKNGANGSARGGKPAAGGGSGGAKGGGKPAAPKAPPKPRLAVIIDGVAMAEEEARALWVRFSQHMDAHQGDMAGFAKQEGFQSVTPEHRQGQAVLVIVRRALDS